MYRLVTMIVCLVLLQPAGLAAGDKVVASVDLSDGFVIVQASVNGNIGAYIVDSGAPGLVLNKNRHQLSGESIALSGIAGPVDGIVISSVRFAFDLLEESDLEALAVDLTYLEQAVERPIDGLIGLDLFAGYGLVIDYGNKSLEIVRSDQETPMDDPHIALPITLDGHVPVVLLQSNKRTLRFGIDTGSRSNLIAKSALSIVGPCDEVQQIALTGADQKTVITSKIEIGSLTARGISLGPTPMVVSDLSGTKGHLDQPLDGILGHAFFGGRKVFINASRTLMLVSGSQESIVQRAPNRPGDLSLARR